MVQILLTAQITSQPVIQMRNAALSQVWRLSLSVSGMGTLQWWIFIVHLTGYRITKETNISVSMLGFPERRLTIEELIWMLVTPHCGLGPHKVKSKSKLSSSIHVSPLPDCGHSVSSCLTVLLPDFPVMTDGDFKLQVLSEPILP